MVEPTEDTGSISEAPSEQSSRLEPSKEVAAPSSPKIPKWPNPEESIGEFCSRIPGTDSSYWKIKDPGREKLDSLLEEAYQLLDEKNRVLDRRVAFYWDIFHSYDRRS
jgi:hypothetical protein